MLKGTFFRTKYQLYRPATFDLYKKLLQSQFWSRDQMHAYCKEKQKELVLHAFRNSSFYEKLYRDVGFDYGDVEQCDYFTKLPVLTKNHLRESFSQILDNKLHKFLSVSTTGGSTGVPVRCGNDRRFPVEAYGWRTLAWWGLRPWDDGGYVWRNPRDSIRSRLINNILWWPTRKIKLDASSMSSESMRTFLKKWNQLKPPQLQGYVGAVVELARFIESQGIEFHPPKTVWVTSAPLLPMQRSLLERVFCAPVYDQYGCCEVSWVAAQCERKDALHVNFERVFVEFVDELDKPVIANIWGRTLLTRFDDFVFPLIRYEVGDRGRFIAEPCQCGRNLPLIDKVKGRLTDVFRLPSGRVLSGEFLTTIFDDSPDAVNAFCVVQKKDSSIEIQIVPSLSYSVALGEIVRTRLAEKVGGEVAVFLNLMESISHDRGKIRFVIRED
jgi:phenylacetate-CoA ligase